MGWKVGLGVAAGAEPSMLLLDISTGDLKSPSSWKKANSWAVQKRCISLHIHHTSNHCTQWMNAHHSHSLAWGQTRLVALMWNTSHNKAACKQKILFTGRLSKKRPVLAVCILSLLPLLMFVFAAFISMHAPDYVGLFIQTVVCINVLHFSAGMVWVWWRYRQQGIGFKWIIVATVSSWWRRGDGLILWADGFFRFTRFAAVEYLF